MYHLEVLVFLSQYVVSNFLILKWSEQDYLNIHKSNDYSK